MGESHQEGQNTDCLRMSWRPRVEFTVEEHFERDVGEDGVRLQQGGGDTGWSRTSYRVWSMSRSLLLDLPSGCRQWG